MRSMIRKWGWVVGGKKWRKCCLFFSLKTKQEKKECFGSEHGDSVPIHFLLLFVIIYFIFGGLFRRAWLRWFGYTALTKWKQCGGHRVLLWNELVWDLGYRHLALNAGCFLPQRLICRHHKYNGFESIERRAYYSRARRLKQGKPCR